MLTRRQFIRSSFALAASPVLVPHAIAETLTAQEALVMSYMASRGVQKFIMMNEKSGRLLAVSEGKISFSVPAISGMTRGDDLAKSPGATPAGIYPLTFSPQQGASDAVMLFKDAGTFAYVIHRATNGPQRRIELLNGQAGFKSPDRDLRLSTGCINVRPKDYDLVSGFASRAQQTMKDTGPGSSLKASYLVILPETSNLAETRRFFGISETVAPQYN